MKLSAKKQSEYENYVNAVTPTHSLIRNILRAFLTGGSICLVGQIITNYLLKSGLAKEMASSWCSVILVFISVLFTGFNIYPSIGKYGGAGSLVPITGFANSVAASAIEYKTEGWIMGTGSKIFIIAGPVILYGILTSWFLGIIYYILMGM